MTRSVRALAAVALATAAGAAVPAADAMAAPDHCRRPDVLHITFAAYGDALANVHQRDTNGCWTFDEPSHGGGKHPTLGLPLACKWDNARPTFAIDDVTVKNDFAYDKANVDQCVAKAGPGATVYEYLAFRPNPANGVYQWRPIANDGLSRFYAQTYLMATPGNVQPATQPNVERAWQALAEQHRRERRRPVSPMINGSAIVPERQVLNAIDRLCRRSDVSHLGIWIDDDHTISAARRRGLIGAINNCTRKPPKPASPGGGTTTTRPIQMPPTPNVCLGNQAPVVTTHKLVVSVPRGNSFWGRLPVYDPEGRGVVTTLVSHSDFSDSAYHFEVNFQGGFHVKSPLTIPKWKDILFTYEAVDTCLGRTRGMVQVIFT